MTFDSEHSSEDIAASLTLWWLTAPMSRVLEGATWGQCLYVARKIEEAEQAQLAFGPLPKEMLDAIGQRHAYVVAEAVARRMTNSLKGENEDAGQDVR